RGRRGADPQGGGGAPGLLALEDEKPDVLREDSPQERLAIAALHPSRPRGGAKRRWANRGASSAEQKKPYGERYSSNHYCSGVLRRFRQASGETGAAGSVHIALAHQEHDRVLGAAPAVAVLGHHRLKRALDLCSFLRAQRRTLIREIL